MTLAYMIDDFNRKWRLVFDNDDWAEKFADSHDLEIIQLKQIAPEKADKIIEIEH
ncbi:hypothetical protein [Paenibacillus oleatilyticus]|uniref:hypothetical protein n=1 Tax=Paenibacillus oleatilyticus TaxID=2594886 RepID=UPI001C1F2211|nr:hypothetical protein [Paenibacillus oleatilyticus]MBU7316117.1 hypothetical protein [Paenibacillus oleatilyticus]